MASHLRLVKPSETRSGDRVATGILREFGSAFVKKRLYYWLYDSVRYRLERRRR